MSSSIDPLIPVYLNQRIVFDLTAMLEGGIATVTRIETAERLQTQTEGEVTGSFGLASALASLVKVDFGGRAKGVTSDGSGTSRTEDRVHTPASLFQRLREQLEEASLSTTLECSTEPKAGQIVEFETSVRRNPVTQLLGTFAQLIDMLIQFGGNSGGNHKKGGGGSAGEMKKIRSQIDGLVKHLEAGRTVDVVSDKVHDRWRALLTLEREYLNDPRMSDLADGQFKVLGKVIRVVQAGDDSINLLRNTPLSAFREHLLVELMSRLEEVGRTGEIVVPDMEWEVPGPVFHVIPIAIYA